MKKYPTTTQEADIAVIVVDGESAAGRTDFEWERHLLSLAKDRNKDAMLLVNQKRGALPEDLAVEKMARYGAEVPEASLFSRWLFDNPLHCECNREETLDL
jgi:hypothetical protein